MADSIFVEDNQVLWIKVPKRGTPATWQPGHNYNLGDTVVPSASVVVPPSDADNMFQCVGFIGKTGNSQPSFPATSGSKVIDNNIEWTARVPSADPIQPSAEEYYYLTRNITVSST